MTGALSKDYAKLNATITGHNLYLTTVLSKAYNEKVKGQFLLQVSIHCWLVVLRLNVPVNNFSVMSGRSHRFLGN